MHLLAKINITLPTILNVHNPKIDLIDPNNFLSSLVSRILVFVIFIAGFHFMFKLIEVGYKMLTSTGEPGKVQVASQELTNSALGLVIIISTFFIIQIIDVIFGIHII